MKGRLQDWAILIALLSISVLTLTTRNESLLLGIRSIALQSTAGIENQLANTREYFNISADNARLRDDNIRLSSELARIREAGLLNEELHHLLSLKQSAELDVVGGRVITKDITERTNYLTLNVGTADSVETGMAVIHSDGVIGTVFFASKNYCRVLPFLNVASRLPARIQESGAEGIVRWQGFSRDELVMEHVVKTVDVVVGQRVVTSGNSATFPPGHPIGVVTSAEIQQGRNELEIKLKPEVNFDELKYAFVVRSKIDPELEEAMTKSVTQQ